MLFYFLPFFSSLINLLINWYNLLSILICFEIFSILFLILTTKSSFLFMMSLLLLVTSSLVSFLFLILFVRQFGKSLSKCFSF